MNIFYIVFGHRCENHVQAYFSLCSFLSQTDQLDRIYMMTDAPEFYQKLNAVIHILPIMQEQLSDWQGERQFFWRIKIKAIEFIFALHPNEQVVYWDNDTFLFSDIKQLREDLGNPLMHVQEGDLCRLKSKIEKWIFICSKMEKNSCVK